MVVSWWPTCAEHCSTYSLGRLPRSRRMYYCVRHRFFLSHPLTVSFLVFCSFPLSLFNLPPHCCLLYICLNPFFCTFFTCDNSFDCYVVLLCSCRSCCGFYFPMGQVVYSIHRCMYISIMYLICARETDMCVDRRQVMFARA